MNLKTYYSPVPVEEINALFHGWSSHNTSERVSIWEKQLVDILLFPESYTFKMCTFYIW